MKKILLSILLILAFATSANATTWYACAGSKNINSVSGGTTSDVWYSAAACVGGSWYAWTTNFDDGLLAGDILEANAQTALAINVNPGATGKKVHLKTLSGGGFTYATASALHMDMDVTAGTTEGIAITGSQAGDAGTIHGNIIGGSASGAEGITDGHTVGTITVTGDITGGSFINGYGYAITGTGIVAVTGNATGATAPAFRNASSGNSTISGNCTGSSTATPAQGCVAASTGAITVTGNIINGTRSAGVEGTIKWTPAAANYIKTDGGGTAVYASQAPSKAKVLTDTSVVVSTTGAYEAGTASSGGGGGAWGF